MYRRLGERFREVIVCQSSPALTVVSHIRMALRLRRSMVRLSAGSALRKGVNSMPEGTCKKCGKKYYGWALQQPQYRVCDCGGEIEVTEVTIKTEDGEVLGEETTKLLKHLQAGVFYFPQR